MNKKKINRFKVFLPTLIYYRAEYLKRCTSLGLEENDFDYIYTVLQKYPFWTDEQIRDEVMKLRLEVEDMKFKAEHATFEVLNKYGYE